MTFIRIILEVAFLMLVVPSILLAPWLPTDLAIVVGTGLACAVLWILRHLYVERGRKTEN